MSCSFAVLMSDERCENGPCLGAGCTAGEQAILLSQAYRLDAALDRIVVYFNTSVINEARQAVPMDEGVPMALPRPDFFETSSSRASSQRLKSSISGLVSVCRTAA